MKQYNWRARGSGSCLRATAHGAVAASSAARISVASARLPPHISGPGRSEAQNGGRSGRPNRRQRSASSSCTQGTPAGFPAGMPGIGEVIDGAVQQAAQPLRQAKARGAGACMRPV